MKEYVFRSKYLDFDRHLKKGNLYLKSATTYSFALILILLSQAQYEGSILRIFIYVTFAFFLGRYYGDNHAKKS